MVLLTSDCLSLMQVNFEDTCKGFLEVGKVRPESTLSLCPKLF